MRLVSPRPNQKLSELWIPVPLADCMKNRNLLTKLTPLVTVLLTLDAARTQADILPPFHIGFALTRTEGAAQQNQAPARSTPQVPQQVRYMVIELGGRRANYISQSGQIVGNRSNHIFSGWLQLGLGFPVHGRR